MISVIHQPYFLPWLGYFNKLAHADNFIVLDNVQYRRRYFHNRVHIKNMHGKKAWVTLPVGSGNYGALQKDIVVVSEKKVQDVFKTIHNSYASAPYYKRYWPRVEKSIEDNFPSLLNINVGAIQVILSFMNLSSVRISFASTFCDESDATQRLIKLCHATQSNTLIMGPESWSYHDVERIFASGIQAIQQDFIHNHPVYPQLRDPYIARLSIIDALFNIGADETLRLIKGAWYPRV